MRSMAKAGLPLLFISRTEDDVVPIEENTDIFATRYARLGGPVKVIRRPGGHHPHGFDNPAHIAVSYTHLQLPLLPAVRGGGSEPGPD